jgi:hypothetical protein
MASSSGRCGVDMIALGRGTPKCPSYTIRIGDACSSPCPEGGEVHVYSTPEWESRLRTMGVEYDKIRKLMQNAWHEQAWRGHTNDSHRDEHKSTEFGWSVMVGGSMKQRVAQVSRCKLVAEL